MVVVLVVVLNLVTWGFLSGLRPYKANQVCGVLSCVLYIYVLLDFSSSAISKCYWILDVPI
jgi:hypothetical protein